MSDLARLLEHIATTPKGREWLDTLRELAAKVEQPKAIVFPLLFTQEMTVYAKLWLRHRSEIRHPLKASSREAFFRKCIEWGDIRAIAAIEYSIAQGYQGLIEPKNHPTYGQPATEDEYTAKRRAVAEANAKHYGVANAGTGH